MRASPACRAPAGFPKARRGRWFALLLACAHGAACSPSGSTSPASGGATGGSSSGGSSSGNSSSGGSSGGGSSGGGSSGGGSSGGSSSSGSSSSGSSSGGCKPSALYGSLPDGAGGLNLEQVSYDCVPTFDKAASLATFQATLYPLLRSHCASCHSTETQAQAPIHADVDPALAHAYALTRANLRHPEDSKLLLHVQLIQHHCFGRGCSDASSQLLAALRSWAAAVKLPEVPRPIPADTAVTEEEVRRWIAADRAALPAADAEFMAYASLHEMHVAGLAADQLNVARAALSKVLNATARWAPRIANPVDVNGKGLVYRFDIRDYWGWNKGVRALIFGGSDDDIFFGDRTDLLGHRFGFARTVSRDPAFARMVWARVQEGSKEAYQQKGGAANVRGFHGDWVEVSQLVYTLTRPDVYNAIMAIPVYAEELEEELGLVQESGAQSYRWVAVDHGITFAPRMMFRADTASGGFYWKSFDIFTGAGQVYPFWENPIPRFVSLFGDGAAAPSLLATLAQPREGSEPAACQPATSFGGYSLCTHYTGTGGVQQHASEIIWSLPNGLHGYMIGGGLNQRRTDAFSFIVVDPRRIRSAADDGGSRGELRLTNAGSCMGCHEDGMKRENADLRDRLEAGTLQAAWTGDAAVTEQVRKLYPTTRELRPLLEADHRPFVEAMARIREGMMLGEDKNLGVEPIVWTFEWAQAHHAYADTISN